ncbi:MAG: Antilisterial bacteriocin subtilosin biosynthesis protein AlbA [Syntrophomonadaceae bacterium]|nr:Antilisterial bacteriocin subtilosin biosynthesis protein AlbA [Bacillota bacterium]
MSDYKPYLVSWNLTKRCNLSCPHCYIDSNPPSEGGLNSELTRQEARFVIDELSYLNTSLMLVLSGGEPMLREDIFDIVEYASQAGFITVLGSNGTLLTCESLKMLKDAGLKGVGISIDSPENTYHDSFRGLEGAWELSMAALRDAKGIGLETLMDVTVTEQNWQEIDDLVEIGVSLGAKAINFFFLICTGRAMKTDISTSSYDRTIRHIAEISVKEKRLMVRARCAPHIYRILHEKGVTIPEGTKGCLAGRHYMRIDPEGNVTPCPYMPLVVGTVRERSLSSIWEDSPHLRLMREGSYKGRCGVCEYGDLCGGCRARALIGRGDFMEEDSLCTYLPSGKSKVVLKDTFQSDQSDLLWEDKAKDRIKKIPIFMRGMITRVIEAKARERGISLITSELIDELKSHSYRVV